MAENNGLLGFMQGVGSIPGALRSGIYDPWGNQRKLAEQNIAMNQMELARERLNDYQNEALIQVSSGAPEETVLDAIAYAAENDPILKGTRINGPIARTYAQYMIEQAKSAQAQEAGKAQSEREKSTRENISALGGLSKSIRGGEIPPEAAEVPYGRLLGFLGVNQPVPTSSLMPKPEVKRDMQLIDTVDAQGRPIKIWTDKNTVNQGEAYQTYQSPDYQLFGAQGQPPLAFNMNNPSGQPIPTGLPTGYEPLSKSSTNVTVNPTINNMPLGQAPSNQLQQDIITGTTSRENLMSVLDNYDESFSRIYGKIGANAVAASERLGVDVLADKLGFEGQTDKAQKYLADYTDFLTKGIQYFNAYRAEITKAQASMKEIEWLTQSTLDVKTDSPTEVKQKIKTLLEIGQRVENRRKIFLKMGIDLTSVPRETYDTIVPTAAIPSDKEITDSEAEKIASAYAGTPPAPVIPKTPEQERAERIQQLLKERAELGK